MTIPKNTTPSTELPSVTFDTKCLCGRMMTVRVTFGSPPTFRVEEGHHSCSTWAAACKMIIEKGEAIRAR